MNSNITSVTLSSTQLPEKHFGIKIKGAQGKTLSEVESKYNWMRFTQKSIDLGNRILTHNLNAMHQCAVKIGSECNLTDGELEYMLDYNGDIAHDILAAGNFIRTMEESADEPKKMKIIKEVAKTCTLHQQHAAIAINGLEEDINLQSDIAMDKDTLGGVEREIYSDPSLIIPGEESTGDTVPPIFLFDE